MTTIIRVKLAEESGCEDKENIVREWRVSKNEKANEFEGCL